MADVDAHAITEEVAAVCGLPYEKAEALVAHFEEFFAKPFAAKLLSLHINDIIRNKNPYLYRASGIETCEQLVSRAFNDYVSSSVEGYFGPFFEAVARVISGGVKPPKGGEVDLFIKLDGTVRLYVIKSGSKGFNSSSYDKAKRDIDSAEARLWQDKVTTEKRISFAYGRRAKTSMKGGIVHLSSKDFWAELSGDPNFYKKLLDVCALLAPLYVADMQAPLADLLKEAQESFCEGDSVNWDKVMALVSG